MSVARTALAFAAVAAGVWALAAVETPSGPAGEGPAEAPMVVKVVPARVEEHRTLDLTKKKLADLKGFGDLDLSELKVTVHLLGHLAAKASRYGMLNIETARDDRGGDLIREVGLGGDGDFQTIGEWERQDVENGFALELVLKAAPRSAKKIATLSGSVQLVVGGQEKTVLVKDVETLVGRAVADPVLKAAGIDMKIVESSAARGLFGLGPDEKAICCTLTGNTHLVLEVLLADSTGKESPSDRGWSRSGAGPKVHHIRPAGRMPAKAALKLKVLTGARLAPVALKLRDIPLP